MSISALHILNVKGKILISRDYRGDTPPETIDKFLPLLMENEDESSVAPVFQCQTWSFCYIPHNDLYIIAVAKKNANVTMIFVFLHKLVRIMTDYFKVLEEESILDNFVLIYELLDELLDFGYPQTTDCKILKEYITQEGFKLEAQPRIPTAVTNAVSWRPEGLRHKRNEVFLDVVESINLLANANSGSVLRSECMGVLKLKVNLSGMPELRLGLNDRVLFENFEKAEDSTFLDNVNKTVELEDVKFHQCVRLSRFEADRAISFVPPDGEFELMSYRLNTPVKPLIWIECVTEHHPGSRIEFVVLARSQFKKRSTANNVEILVPVPRDVDTPTFCVTQGHVTYVPEQDTISWRIKSFPGGKEYIMNAQFRLPSVQCEDKEKKQPIRVKFEIPYFTTSGLQVRYLKIIEKSGYKALPWVRYISQNGDYELRF